MDFLFVWGWAIALPRTTKAHLQGGAKEQVRKSGSLGLLAGLVQVKALQ
jgi:hypothetical protein